MVFPRERRFAPPPIRPRADVPALITCGDSRVFKGVAILLMIFHHGFGFTERIPAGAPCIDFLTTHPFVRFLGLGGKICVPIFLFITGLGLASAAEKPFAGTLKKSLSRYYGVYLPSLIVGGLLLMFFPVEYPDGIVRSATWKMLRNALVGRAGPLCDEWWYASLFLTAVLLFAPLCRFVFPRCGNGVSGAVRALILLVAWRVGMRMVGGAFPYSHFMPAFVLGWFFGAINLSEERVVASARRFRERAFPLRAMCAGTAFLACIVVWATNHQPTALCCVLLFAVWAVVRERSACGKVLAFLGKYSALMWLNHSFFLYFYLRQELYSLGSVPAVFLAATALSLAAAIVMQAGLDALCGSFPRKIKHFLKKELTSA